jgi:hypothetical protein
MKNISATNTDANPVQHQTTVWGWQDAIRQARLSNTQKSVALFIALYMNQLGQGAFPSYKRLASDASLSRTSVINSVSALVSAGFLVKQKRIRKTGSHTSNLYQCSYPEWCSVQPIDESTDNTVAGGTPSEPQGVHTTDEGGKPDVLGVVHSADEGGTSLVPHINTPSITPSEHPNLTNDVDGLFEVFWQAYGKHGNRKPAIKAFKTALKRTTFATIMDGLKRYQEYAVAMGTAPNFIKHASTWLNNDCWQDPYTIYENPNGRVKF